MCTTQYEFFFFFIETHSDLHAEKCQIYLSLKLATVQEIMGTKVSTSALDLDELFLQL
jgi:hypothetical protein